MNPQNSEQSQWFVDTIEPHEEVLRHWLMGRFPSIDSIEDILQETYLRALKARDEGKLYAPRAFLFTTARNLALDLIRRAGVAEKYSLTEYDTSNVSIDETSIPEMVSLNQEFEMLDRAIASLPEKCREIFIMRKTRTAHEIKFRFGLNTTPLSP